MDKIELRVRACADIMGNPEVGIILVTDVQKRRQMAIVCDTLTKLEIQQRMAHNPECNTMLPEVLAGILTRQMGFRCEIIINDIVDGTYRAMLVNTDTGQPQALRAADAVLMHMITHSPLYATPSIMKRQSIPFVADSPAMALPFNALSDVMLRNAMQAAVESEHYEAASVIRDELKKRGKL